VSGLDEDASATRTTDADAFEFLLG